MISKRLEPIPEPASFSSLPDEITENILARVSRWNYPWLSLVSKKFRSLLSSMVIYETRSQIGATEACVYVSLQLPNQPHPSWFSLWSKPNQILTKQRRRKTRFKKNPSGNSVVPIPLSSSFHSPSMPNAVVAVGPEIYIVGDKEPSSSARIIDCRSYTWRDVPIPNMTVARENASWALFHGKLLMMGGCADSANLIEVFDIKTQSRTALPGPDDDDEELRDQLQNGRCNIVAEFDHEGKFYVATGKKDYIYEPNAKDGAWKVIKEQSSFLNACMLCSIENVAYCYTYSGCLMWSEPFNWEWKKIKGLEKLHEHHRNLTVGNARLMENYGEKLLVMWDPYRHRRKVSVIRIWYAVISLESRCNGREVWGNVECVDVLTFPGESYESLLCVIPSV